MYEEDSISGASPPVTPPPPPTFAAKMGACCRSTCGCLASALAFFISHVGLVALVAGYCLLGGVIFEKLEGEHELKVTKYKVTECL